MRLSSSLVPKQIFRLWVHVEPALLTQVPKGNRLVTV